MHLGLGGGNGASAPSQKDAVPWVPDIFQVGIPCSPLACHEDLGADGASSGRFCMVVTSFVFGIMYHRKNIHHALLFEVT